MAEITREFGYDNNHEPVMILRRKRQVATTYQLEKKANPSFAIRLCDIWQYSEEHNPFFKRHVWDICNVIHHLFDLGLVTGSKLAAIATVIQEGIDDLVKMPPQPTEKVTLGEVRMRQTSLNGDGHVDVKKQLDIERPVSIH